VPSPNDDFIAIAASDRHSMGLKSDGSIVVWGSNEWGQCDLPSLSTGFLAVAAGWRHSMALVADNDGDGIPDDGDGSGVAGDHPCTGGNTVECDDNCPSHPNPDQADIDNDGIGDACDAPSILSAGSRRWHPAAPFDIPIPIGCSSAAIECRTGSLPTIVAEFTRPIQPADGLLDDEVTCTPGSCAAVIEQSVITIELADVPDPSCLTITFTGLVDADDNPMDGPNQLCLAILGGDTTNNKAVNAFDLTRVRANLGQPVTSSNFRSDVNASGAINAFDLTAVRARLGHSLLCP
jgi:hypothetical protein